jgi:hypothetical protein
VKGKRQRSNQVTILEFDWKEEEEPEANLLAEFLTEHHLNMSQEHSCYINMLRQST